MVTDTIKSHVLDRAVRDDSPLWTEIDEPTTLHLWDPLDDLNVPTKTRYWPQLPVSNTTIVDPFALCADELDMLSTRIRTDLLGTDHPVLHKAATYFFTRNDTSGKKFRPLLVHLMARAMAEASGDESDFTTDAHRRLAEISELIHTASLFHDDVIDTADTRRGVPAVHKVFGDKMAILAGDYLLARASIGLARLRNVAVVETMSTIIEHLVRGEVMQMKGTDDNDRLQYYLRKNFYKTGSLMANSCRSAAILGDYPEEWVDVAYRYGKHTGMAFQLVDDILDFEGSLSHMGKPALSDLKSGFATAPVLFAADEFPDQLQPLIDRKFASPGDVETALELVTASSGMEQTRQLARVHAETAMDAILELSPNETHPQRTLYRDALIQLAYKVVARTK